MKDFLNKINRNRFNAIYIIIIIFTATSSFGLGKLSVLSEKEPVKIIDTPAINSGSVSTKIGEEEVVASKNSSKYHYPWCSGAKQISQANLISFKSVEEARAQGLTPAQNCEGLR